jgi:terminase large subunit-like protein
LILRRYLQRQVAAERARRGQPMIARALDLLALSFPKQTAFILDESDAAVALCGRRAGKSSGARLLLVKTAVERPGTISVLVTQTRAAAKKLYWQSLQKLLRDLGLPFEANTTELIIRLPNASEIWLAGAKDGSEIERLRGYAFALVVIDEAAFIRDDILRRLVEDILQWALVDHQGKLRLISSPPLVPVGYFVERFTGKDEKGRAVTGWSRHSWTIFDNSKLPQHAVKQYLERLQRDRGISEGSVTWRREVLGELVYDRDALVLSAFDLVESVYQPQQLPTGRPTVVLGVDIGYVDGDAIVALGWFAEANSPDLWVLEEFEQDHETEEQLGVKVKEFIGRWQPIAVAGDTGGGGKKTVEGVSRRIAYPIKPAHKPSVVDQFSRVNDEFRARRLRVPAGGPCSHDAIRVRWAPGKVGVEIAKEPHSDVLPALSYAYAESRRHFEPKKADPNAGLSKYEIEVRKTTWS